MKCVSQRIISFTGLLRVYMVLVLVPRMVVGMVTMMLMVMVSVWIVSMIVPPSSTAQS